MTFPPGRTLTLTPAGLQSRYRESPTGAAEELVPGFWRHLLLVRVPSMVGSANGGENWPNVPGSSLFAAVPIAGSVNAETTEPGRSWPAAAEAAPRQNVRHATTPVVARPNPLLARISASSAAARLPAGAPAGDPGSVPDRRPGHRSPPGCETPLPGVPFWGGPVRSPRDDLPANRAFLDGA